VPGRRHCSQHQVAEPDFAAVADGPPDGRGREGFGHSILRVVATWLAAVQDFRRGYGRNYHGPAHPLQLGDPAGMVVMFVGGENEADVAHPEAELADVFGDEVGIALRAAVDQHVPGASGDQHRRRRAGPDEIAVAVDAHRRRGPVGAVRVLARQRPQRPALRNWRARLLDLARIAERDDDRVELRQRCGGGKQASEHSWLHWRRSRSRSPKPGHRSPASG
jgi:hypothetical protein